MSAPPARPTSSLRGAGGGSEAGQGPPGNPEQYAGHSGLHRFARNDGGKVNHPSPWGGAGGGGTKRGITQRRKEESP